MSSLRNKSQVMFPFSKDKVLFIKYNVDELLVRSDENLKNCAILLKKSPTIVVINKRNELLGTVTNGDIRRLVESGRAQKKIKITAGEVCNEKPFYAHINDSPETLTHLLNSFDGILPLVNSNKAVKAFAYIGEPFFQINDKILFSEKKDIYTIAEIGVNHNGSIDTAKLLIKSAKDAGFSAVKLQIRSNEYFTVSDFNSLDLGAQYIKREIKRTFIDFKGNEKLIQYAKRIGLDIICTPFDTASLDFCVKKKIDGLKIASCDLVNTPLLKKAASSGLPLIISTGMSWEREIVEAYNHIVSFTSNFAFLHCNSTYPCPPQDINLNYIDRMKNMYSCIIGYSSHDSDPLVSALAIAKGAKIIEVHITEDKDQLGTDHKASIPVKELKNFMNTLNYSVEYLGDLFPRSPSQGELLNRLSLSKSLCLSRNIKAGTKLNNKDLELRSPGNGIPYDQIESIIGLSLKKDMIKGEMLNKSDIGISDDKIEKKTLQYAISKLKKKGLVSGVPVRYHDYKNLSEQIPVEFLEFHMSDSDLVLKPNKFIREMLDYRYLFVHAVEQYSDGFIIDFANSDKNITSESISRFKNLIEHICILKKQFKKLEKCSVILNVGGFSSKKIKKKEIQELHENLVSNLSIIKKLADKKNIKILLQTLPPMPWHQGGVAYHNLMVSPESINYLSKKSKMDICLDISHSYLASYNANMDMSLFIDQIKKRVVYLHISDASRLSQEGLQISEGNVELEKVLTNLLKEKKKIFYIPEIWNGHASSGKGFKTAILRLSEII